MEFFVELSYICTVFVCMFVMTTGYKDGQYVRHIRGGEAVSGADADSIVVAWRDCDIR